MNRKHLSLAVAVIALLAGGYYLWSLKRDADALANARPVIVMPVAVYRVADHVEALGNAQANESVNITAQVAEVISETSFDDGQSVAKGDVVVRLQQSEEQAELAAARARMKEHERELGRLKTLLANRAAAKREYDERLTQLEVTRQEAQQIEARIADRTLVAPFDGVLGVRRLSNGALVQPGEIITTLDDLSVIKLDFTIPSLYLPDVTPGMELEAYSEDLRRSFQGKVETVNTRIDPVTRSVLVRAILPNPEGLMKPGLLMRVSMRKNPREAVLAPEEAIQQRGAGHFATLLNANNEAEERPVKVGLRRPGLVEVTEGLNVGEKLIVRGMGMVRPGQKVSVQEEWKGMTALPEDIKPVKPPVSQSPEPAE